MSYKIFESVNFFFVFFFQNIGPSARTCAELVTSELVWGTTRSGINAVGYSNIIWLGGATGTILCTEDAGGITIETTSIPYVQAAGTVGSGNYVCAQTTGEPNVYAWFRDTTSLTQYCNDLGYSGYDASSLTFHSGTS